MSIPVGTDTRLIVQGITGREGRRHTGRMLAYGTKVVAGVAPGRGGQSLGGIPIFELVKEAKESTNANTSIIFVPARYAPDSIYEAIDAGIDLIVCITEGIPVHEMLKIAAYLKNKNCFNTGASPSAHPEKKAWLRSTILIGPNSPGIITPNQAKVGIMPSEIFMPGPVGIISRSGTLTYEVVHRLTKAGLGQSICIGIGGDPILGTPMPVALRLLADDPDTNIIVLIGEIGGSDEEESAKLIAERIDKPVVAYITGLNAPSGKRLGHAGAIVSMGSGTAESKIEALKAAGAKVASELGEIAKMVKEIA